jgi:hypothetical protein
VPRPGVVKFVSKISKSENENDISSLHHLSLLSFQSLLFVMTLDIVTNCCRYLRLFVIFTCSQVTSEIRRGLGAMIGKLPTTWLFFQNLSRGAVSTWARKREPCESKYEYYEMRNLKRNQDALLRKLWPLLFEYCTFPSSDSCFLSSDSSGFESEWVSTQR